MSKHIKPWLISFGKSIQSAVIVRVLGALVAAGLFAYLADSFLQLRARLSSLWNTPISLGVLLIVLLIACPLFLILGYYIGRPKAPRILEQLLVPINDAKWQTTVYSNKKFTVEPIPYCPKHEMALIDANTHYVCPVLVDCKCVIDLSELSLLQAQAKSIIAKGIKEQYGF